MQHQLLCFTQRESLVHTGYGRAEQKGPSGFRLNLDPHPDSEIPRDKAVHQPPVHWQNHWADGCACGVRGSADSPEPATADGDAQAYRYVFRFLISVRLFGITNFINFIRAPALDPLDRQRVTPHSAAHTTHKHTEAHTIPPPPSHHD
eukprot:4228020-Prymnesium_polylepis.2